MAPQTPMRPHPPTPPQHTITLQPDTTGRGVPASDLIALYVNKGHAVCPLCGQQVAVPKAVADELWRTAATPQTRQVHYAFAIHHPKGIAVTMPKGAKPITDPARIAQAAERSRAARGKR